MARINQITYRAAYNSLALSTLGACPVWDAALKRFLATNCLQHADIEHGALSQASEQAAFERMRLESLYGSKWRGDPRAKPAVARLNEAYAAADNAWTEKFAEPYFQAVRDLVLVPAPTIAAAVFKADLIYAEEAWNDTGFEADCMQILQDDFARLTAIPDRSEWDRLVTRYEAVEAIRPEDTTDAIIDESGDLIEQIMAMPAPDASAVRWKLDHVLHTRDGACNDSYAASFLKQTIADYRHFLREA